MAGVTDSATPLAGVAVLDLATFLAAPLCATFLGEFGAEVIKVEQPGVGDDLRRLGPPAGASGSSYWWFVEARNKKSITCNLRDPEGQARRAPGAGARGSGGSPPRSAVSPTSRAIPIDHPSRRGRRPFRTTSRASSVPWVLSWRSVTRSGLAGGRSWTSAYTSRCSASSTT